MIFRRMNASLASKLLNNYLRLLKWLGGAIGTEPLYIAGSCHSASTQLSSMQPFNHSIDS